MSSRPTPPNWVSREQMEEIQAFNASLTQASQRSRPSRSRGRASGMNNRNGSGLTAGRPSGTNNLGGPSFVGGRPTSTSSFGAQNVVRAGNGAHASPMTNWTLGPTTAQPVFKSATPPRSRSRSPTRSASNPTMIGPYQVGPLPSKPLSPPKIRETVLVADGTFPLEQQGQMPQPPLFQQRAGRRERIVSNMTEDDPTKPFIPAHLNQKSAFKAIKHLSEISGVPLEELTSDGVSIPALRPHRVASFNMLAPAPTSAPGPAQQPSQPDVDPSAWMSSYPNKGGFRGGYATPATQTTAGAFAGAPRVASYSEMDVDMTDSASAAAYDNGQQKVLRVGTMKDSQWAADSHLAATLSEPSASSIAPSTTAFQSQPCFGGGAQNGSTAYGAAAWNNFGSMENVKPAAGQHTFSNQAKPKTTNIPAETSDLIRALEEAHPGKKLATLKDSRWA